MYYDKAGHAISPRQCGELLEDPQYRRVVETVLPDGTWVSTVWIGLDHDFGGQGPPLIFETRAVPSTRLRTSPSRGGREAIKRYSTLEAAQAGHEEMVQRFSGVG